MVGIYDSGVGGLSVLRRLWVHLPAAPVLYVADSAHAPYGCRSPDELAFFGSRIARFLKRQGATVLVVACNTSSAVALPAVQEAFGGPVVGMLEPAARSVAALAGGRPGGAAVRVGVLATPTTVASGAYVQAIRRVFPHAEVLQQACPDWVPLIEAGRLDGPEVEAVVRRDVEALRRAGVQVVVLGCTHYPFWEPVLRRALGSDVELLDPADAVAREAARQLRGRAGGARNGALGAVADDMRWPQPADMPSRRGYDMFFTSGEPASFERLALRLVGAEHARAGRLWCGVRPVRWGEQEVAVAEAGQQVAKRARPTAGASKPVQPTAGPSSPSDDPAGTAAASPGRLPWSPPDWRGLEVAVVGLGAENLPLVRFLVARGARVVACDRKVLPELGPAAEELQRLGVRLCLGPNYLEPLGDVQVAFLTPGMPKRLPAIEAARRAGVLITGQMDLFLRLCRAPVVGITGSAGKTTTTTLVGRMLRADGRRVFVGGNIGEPLIDRVEEIGPDAWVVLELSSFQLETTAVSPHGSVVTNISPNHLDVHEDMEAYVAAKEHIVAFQGPGDFAVLNADDPVVRAMARRTPGQVLWFSLRGTRLPGAWVEGDRLLAAWAEPSDGAANGLGGVSGSRAAVGGAPSRTDEGRADPVQMAAARAAAVRPSADLSEPLEICRRSDIRLRGEHNVANVLAASLAALRCGASVEAIREVVRTFTGVPHRLEEVARLDGVLFVNDSIATSPARAIAALHSFQEPVVLIAGGYDKHLPFDDFARVAVERCRHIVLLGQTADAIRAALDRALAEAAGLGPTISRARTFEEAVEQARAAARPGDVVLLSPACASYDMFRNFEERGARFRELVRAMTGEAQRVGAS